MSEYKLSDRMERIVKAMYDSEKGITYVLYVDNGNIYTVREHIITGAREETANAWQIEIDELANMGLLYGSPEQNYILTSEYGEPLVKRLVNTEPRSGN